MAIDMDKVALDRGGYVGGFSPECEVDFVNGVGHVYPIPRIVYQVVTAASEFVWRNVFSDIKPGTGNEVSVAYYIRADGTKVYGTQKKGSFGQPAEPGSTETPGKIVLSTSLTGRYRVNFAVPVPDVFVEYGQPYEAWPFWRYLAKNEFASAGDAIHWLYDAFKLLKETDKTNTEWPKAHARILGSWDRACTQESDTTLVFKQGTDGEYNNFPLTYSYAFGRQRANDPSTNWNVQAPSAKFSIERNTTTGMVDVVLPKEDGTYDSADPIRYGWVFENKPVYITLTPGTKLEAQVSASRPTVLRAEIGLADGRAFTGSLVATTVTEKVSVPVNAFKLFQQNAGDATGDKTGDWSDEPEIPEVPGVNFPGHRVALVGDSITWYNSYYFPRDPVTNRLEYYSMSMAGYFTYANALMDQRMIFEPSNPSDITGRHMGLNFAVAGSRVAQWWERTINPIGTDEMGPMYAALNTLDDWDIALLMGGTNDLAGNLPASEISTNIVKAAAELASKGKWVFVGAIPPRSRGELKGYTIQQQDAIRTRLLQVNQTVKARLSTIENIWFVDYYADLLGPNGVDPLGTQSDNLFGGADTAGNFNPDYPGQQAMHDGLHPGAVGAYIMGKKFAQVMLAAGIPARSISGSNLVGNPDFNFTQYLLPPTPQSGFSDNWMWCGWATGLGAMQRSGLNFNGYPQGRMPDNWHFYKGVNSQDQTIGAAEGNGGTFSNFMEYTWQSLSWQYPEIAPFTTDSTWGEGAVKTAIKTDSSGPYIELTLNIPAGSNPQKRNQCMVINTHIPIGQHGPWDAYGYITSDNGPVRPNTVYATGDKLTAYCDVEWNLTNGKMNSSRFLMNLLGVDNTLMNTSLAYISGITMSHNYWPPSELPKVTLPRKMQKLRLKTPQITVPAYQPNEDRRYAQLRLEVSFDDYQEAVAGTIKLRNVKVYKG